jgi:hypothetical protein
VVSGLAFLATAVASLFAEATFVRWTRRRKPHELAWTISLVMFALASAALASGASTGWDDGTFRAFYLLGAVLNVPWLALGTVYLLFGTAVGRRVQWGLVLFTGFAAGVLLSTPITHALPRDTIPVGKDVFGALPRVLAAAGSGVAAIVIVGGALWSAAQFARRRREPGAARLVGANSLIAVGTLVLSSGGLVQGAVGKDEAFTLTLATGITVIYVGFLVAEAGRRQPAEPALSRSTRRSTLPAKERGSASTTSTRVGHL